MTSIHENHRPCELGPASVYRLLIGIMLLPTKPVFCGKSQRFAIVMCRKWKAPRRDCDCPLKSLVQ